ncbi:hypothetical protein Salat_1138500 [Sesamum alatum]|uniref:Small nuclear ribonucleoprotein Prp3 C-terminal domain-containing protein n=1 Tax=Sesamum alatum TaxID=300844 RepID=A0AAE2CNH5_9LAMI|nr:hypothetical protein Salat_1138500 [Sesamum alatum]
MEEELSSPCKRRRYCRFSGKFGDGQSPETFYNTPPPATPPKEDINNLDLESEKNEPKMIVLALFAPSQMENKNPTMKNAKSRNLDASWLRRQQQMLLGGGGAATATTAVSICKITDLSCSCRDLLKNGRLRLSGCAVISKGIVVVEDGISSMRKCLRFMRRNEEEKAENVKVIWQGKVAKPSFGNFSILHCSGAGAACKFFADHGASDYWDLVAKST